MCGFLAIVFFTGEIFHAAGSPLNSNMSSIIVGSVQVMATVISTFLVDRVGRRLLLISSHVVLTMSLILLGTFFFLKDGIGQFHLPPLQFLAYFQWLPLVCILTFITGFSLGVGPLSFTMMGELLPPNVKGKTIPHLIINSTLD